MAKVLSKRSDLVRKSAGNRARTGSPIPNALIENPTPASTYRALKCSVLIMRGAHSLKPSRIIAQRLAELLPDSRLLVIGGAGHMGSLHPCIRGCSADRAPYRHHRCAVVESQEPRCSTADGGRVMINTPRQRRSALRFHLRSLAAPTR